MLAASVAITTVNIPMATMARDSKRAARSIGSHTCTP
jgi:hypothetical protein